MTLLIIAFIIAVTIAVVAADNETLEDKAESRWVNHLAAESRKKKIGRKARYTKAGYWY